MKKKITALALALLMVMTALAAPALAANISTTVKTTSKNDVLNVRKGPHKGNTPVVDYVKNGTKITLLSTHDSGDPEAWNRIKVNKTGAVGYLKNKYIAYFGLSNHNGEVDPYEDDDWDYSDADDNDGKQGSGTAAGGSGGSSTGGTSLRYGTVKCKADGSVNVRSGASTGHKVVGSGYNGDEMSIHSTSGSWYRVTFIERNLSGYIHSDYVTAGVASKVNANGVNLRKGAGTGYASIRKLSSGTSVRVLSKSGSWSRINVDGTYGWVFSQYLDRY